MCIYLNISLTNRKELWKAASTQNQDTKHLYFRNHKIRTDRNSTNQKFINREVFLEDTDLSHIPLNINCTQALGAL